MGGIGDVDGDGINDIAVGAHRDDDGGSDRGAVYVLFLNGDGTSDTAGGLAASLDDSDRFVAVAGIGDLGGDGINDIAVGAFFDDDGGTDRGAVYVLHLAAANNPPTDIGLAPATVAESVPIGTVVGTLSTTDPDPGDTHTYALVAGVGDGDNALFTVVGDQLQTAAALDFETLGSPLNIRVETTDSGTGNLTFEEAMTVTLTDVNEAPTDIGLAPSTVAENVPIGTVVGTFTTTDPDPADTHTYALVIGVGDGDNALFTIVGDQLQTAVALDFETLGSPLNIRVETTDSGTGNLTYEEAMTVTLTDQNEAPTDIALAPATVAENVPIGTVVGTFTSTDPDPADTHTYALVAGVGDADNGLFTVVGDQLQTAVALDFETLGSPLNIRVETTDSGTGNLTYEEAMTVTLTDVNEAPTDIGLAPSTVAENVPIGTVVGTFTTTDPDPADG